MTETVSLSVSDRLRELAFTQGFPDAYYWRLSKAMTPRSFVAGEVLFAEGHPRAMFALLVEGAVAIDKSAEGGAVRLSTIGVGEPIGEGLLLGDTAKHGTTAR